MRVSAIALLAAASLGLVSCTDNGGLTGNDEVSSVSGELAVSIDEAVASAMQLSGSDGAVVGVWSASGEYVQGYGEGIAANSAIRAAQASQPVMCALVLDLVESGEMKLDRKVSKDLPRQVGIEDITYGQLCDATSGLGDFKAHISDIFSNNPARPWSDRELFAHALAESPGTEPGTTQLVSDSGALLLARALPRVGGASISALLEDRVFGPAGMSRSSFPSDLITATELSGNALSGYTYQFAAGAPVCTVPGEAEGETLPADPTPVPSVSPSMLSGAGATVTTVTDLKRFYERYLSGGYGESNADLVTSLWSPPATDDPVEAPAEAPAEGEEAVAPTDGWTFGLAKHGPLYGMSGKMTGTLTAAYHDPTSGFTVVVALNNSSAGADFVRALAFQLAAIAGAGGEWTAEDQAAALASLAVCQPAPEEAPAEG